MFKEVQKKNGTLDDAADGDSDSEDDDDDNGSRAKRRKRRRKKMRFLALEGCSEKFIESVSFPESVTGTVYSSIVYHDKWTNKQKFLALCDKYILDNSEFSVNISYKCRKRLTDKCEDIVADYASLAKCGYYVSTVSIKYTDFDLVLRQLFKLMTDSQSRFEPPTKHTISKSGTL